MLDKVFGGHGSVGSTIIPPMYENWHLTPPNEVTYDPDKAKSLLDAAGYRVGPDGIRTAENGARLDFRLFGRSDSPTSKKAVEYIKRYLAESASRRTSRSSRRTPSPRRSVRASSTCSSGGGSSSPTRTTSSPR